MQVIVTNDNKCHVYENVSDLMPLVEEYMGRDAYYLFQDYVEKVDDMVSLIQEHIVKLDKINDTLDNVALDNLIGELQDWMADNYDT